MEEGPLVSAVAVNDLASPEERAHAVKVVLSSPFMANGRFLYGSHQHVAIPALFDPHVLKSRLR
jgi:hypothetical protein